MLLTKLLFLCDLCVITSDLYFTIKNCILNTFDVKINGSLLLSSFHLKYIL